MSVESPNDSEGYEYDDACTVVDRFQQQPPFSTTQVEANSSLVVFPRSAGWLWLQLIVILLLTQPIYSPITSQLWRGIAYEYEPSFAQCWIVEVCYYLLVVFVVLFVVRVSGERWSTYGLKPRNLSVDLITGCLAFVCAVAVALVGTDLFIAVLADVQGKAYESPRPFRYWMEAPRDASGLFAMLALAIVVALGEELVARGYLIPTLERLLKSTPLSVVVAAAFFGACHAPIGAVSAWSAFLIGLVFGVFFVWARRLWPLVFAHALIDFSVFIRRPW